MLATMKRRSEEPVPMPDGAGGEVQVDATCFADDVSLYQGSLRAAQRMVQGLEIFCMFTGMRINIEKCRWMSTEGAALHREGGAVAELDYGTERFDMERKGR